MVSSNSILYIFPKGEKFILGGKSIQLFCNEATKGQARSSAEENYPISVHFNFYFSSLDVITP